MTRHRLHIIDHPPEQPTPEEALAMLVPRAMRLEAELADARQRIAEERRRLADKRQVAFIREEHVRREFGAA
jgi:exonuclease VII large subunit